MGWCVDHVVECTKGVVGLLVPILSQWIFQHGRLRSLEFYAKAILGGCVGSSSECRYIRGFCESWEVKCD